MSSENKTKRKNSTGIASYSISNQRGITGYYSQCSHTVLEYKLIRICKQRFELQEIKSIRKAFQFAVLFNKQPKAGRNQYTLHHLLDITGILINELALGSESVKSLLLFHYQQNEDANNINKVFGEQVAIIVDGLQRISREFHLERNIEHSENYIKLMLSHAGDVRAVLIKLAMRLYDMRNLDGFPVEMQTGIKRKVSKLYTPIAHRLGLYNIKTELEEKLMKYDNPVEYYDIAHTLAERKAERDAFIQQFIAPLKKRGYSFEIKGRPKSIYSIWRKMKKQEVTIDKVYDLFAIRIILNGRYKSIAEEKNECWEVFSLITDIYKPNSKRLRDWISAPKETGYESLHITVMGPKGKWVEIQIRTRRMDEIAEKGHAAHWKYKESKSGSNDFEQWLGRLRENLEKPFRQSDTMSPAKIELYSKEIFVFTPKGDLRKLKANATVLDFAFEIHSDLGMQCTGAKVNDAFATLGYKLKNGDVVSIITSKKQKPNRQWLKYVVTSKARSKIKSFLKEAEYKNLELGKDQLRRKLQTLGKEFETNTVNDIVEYFNFNTHKALYQAVGTGEIDPTKIKEVFEQQQQKEEEKEPEADKTGLFEEKELKTNNKECLIIDKNLEKINYDLAKCCNPLPGDRIFAFVTVNKGTKIHSFNCPNAKDMLSKYPYRVIPAKWKQHNDPKASFIATIEITGNDRKDIFENISKNLADINIRSVNIDTKRDYFKGKLKVYVNSTSHLHDLIYRLEFINGIEKAVRV